MEVLIVKQDEDISNKFQQNILKEIIELSADLESTEKFSELNLKNDPEVMNKKKVFSISCMKSVMKSHNMHLLVVFLVIVDSICVSFELILDLVITVHNQYESNNSKSELKLITSNKTLYNADKNDPEAHKSEFNFLWLLISVQSVLKYFGLSILSFFVIEIILKIIFIPRDVIKSKWGVFDTAVVFVSFILDIILLVNKQLLHTVSGLITLFRYE